MKPQDLKLIGFMACAFGLMFIGYAVESYVYSGYELSPPPFDIHRPSLTTAIVNGILGIIGVAFGTLAMIKPKFFK